MYAFHFRHVSRKKFEKFNYEIFHHHFSSPYFADFENERHFEPGEDVPKRVWSALKYDIKRWKRLCIILQAQMDPYQRNNPIAHIKRQTMDLELFPFAAEEIKHRKYSLFCSFFADNDPPDVHFLPMSFMYLACTPEDVERLKRNWKVQTQHGARVDLLTRDQLRERFPFINFDDVLLGSCGLENEGTIDAWQLLSAIREKNLTLGVQYIKGEVEGFFFERKYGTHDVHGIEDDADELMWRNVSIKGAYIRPQMTDASARIVRTNQIVVAAGKGRDLLAVELPVRARKRMVFVVHAPDVPALDMPALFDPSGVYCLMEEVGNTFICGKIPSKEEDEKIDHSNLEIDYDYFYDSIWPTLAKRVPAFKNLKEEDEKIDHSNLEIDYDYFYESIWPTLAKRVPAFKNLKDVNTFDNSPIIGEHLLYKNVHFLCGFGNRGMQHALAVGRSYSEKLLEGAYISLNLRKFDMRRLVKMEKLQEEYG
ncbi:unnamed protein product [Gongylonema pulchrum]|uniref:FAD-dependent oxidoreductase domain-containing protein 1 n=1 Tax=Gongylonema pulchrum TaxID=637853 RepID=A0A183DXB7_9BILA|nr:unnamed protein product [Gongylonema pulchrum]